jgi:hypothetical protein
VVLYPGDRWKIGDNVDIGATIDTYARDYASIPSRPKVPGKKVEIAEVQVPAERFGKHLQQRRTHWRSRVNAVVMNASHRKRTPPDGRIVGRLRTLREFLLMHIRPARIWSIDHETSKEYSLVPRFEVSDAPAQGL